MRMPRVGLVRDSLGDIVYGSLKQIGEPVDTGAYDLACVMAVGGGSLPVKCLVEGVGLLGNFCAK